MDPLTPEQAVKILDTMDESANEFFNGVLAAGRETGKITLDPVALYNLTYAETLLLSEEQLRGALAQKVTVGNIRRFRATIDEMTGDPASLLKEILQDMETEGVEVPARLKEVFASLKSGQCPCPKCTEKRKAEAAKGKLIYFVSARSNELYIGTADAVANKLGTTTESLKFSSGVFDCEDKAYKFFSELLDISKEDVTVINV